MKRWMAAWAALTTVTLLAACAATQNTPTGEAEVRFGRVSQVEMVTIDADKKLGIGAVVGAVAGGLLGKVSKIGDVYIGVELANGVDVQMQRNAVVQVLPKGTLKA